MTKSIPPRRREKSSPNLSEPYEALEVDDILYLRLHGDYTLPIAKELFDRMNILGARLGYLVLLLNVEQFGVVTREARNFLTSNRRREQKEAAIAIVGASFTARTLMMMVIRAVSTLANIPVRLHFFKNEEQAVPWLEEERNRLRRKSATK